MTNDDKPEKITLRELMEAVQPFRCGESRCGQRTGLLHGVPFVEHLEKIAAAAGESLPLGANNQLEITAILSRSKTNFRALVAVLKPAQRNALCAVIADYAFVMSFGTPESLVKLRESGVSKWRQRASRGARAAKTAPKRGAGK